MQKVCPKCHRTFETSREEELRYDQANLYASSVMGANMIQQGDSVTRMNEKFAEMSKANLIRDSIKNPYICPYCGCDIRYYYDSSFSRPQTKEEKLKSLKTIKIAMYICGLFFVLFGLLFLYTIPSSHRVDIALFSLLIALGFFVAAGYCFYYPSKFAKENGLLENNSNVSSKLENMKSENKNNKNQSKKN